MSKLITAVLILLSAMPESVSAANFADDFAAALKLKNTGKYAEAQEAFVKLSEVAPTPLAGDDALVYAAQCATRQKKSEEAFAIAAKIKDAPTAKNCKMELMIDNYKSADLVADFKDEDIGAWPEKIAASGFYRRGFAYATTGNGAKAVADLEKAVEKGLTPNDKVNAAQILGNVYMGQIKDNEKALAAYAVAEKYPSLNGAASFLGSIVNSSLILMKQGKFDEALAKLNMIDQKQIFDYWKANVIATYGDVYLAKGDKTQAAAKYKEALAVEKAPKSLVDAIQKKLEGIK